jgi:hypothetical protein
MSRNSVLRVLERLEKDGLIVKVARAREDGSRTSNEYDVYGPMLVEGKAGAGERLAPAPEKDSKEQEPSQTNSSNEGTLAHSEPSASPPSPPKAPSPPAPKVNGWQSKARDWMGTWTHEFGGEMPFSRYSRVIKKLELTHDHRELVKAFCKYVQSLRPDRMQYFSFEDFAAKIGLWLESTPVPMVRDASDFRPQS